MPDESRRTETMVGLFIFIGLAVLAALTVQFGRFGEKFTGKYSLTVIFDDASGLIRGSEVRMGGAPIGKVSEHPFLNDEVKVEVVLNIDERIRIPEGSSFQIASATLLGDKLIVITPPEKPSGAMIEEDATLAGGGPSGLDALQTNAEAVSRDARRLLNEAENTMHKIDGAIGDIRVATGELTTTLTRINQDVLNEANAKRLENTLTNLETASEGLSPVITDARVAIQSIRDAAEGADQTFAEASDRLEELGPALKKVPNAVDSLARAAEQAADTLDRVEQGEGLLGTLAYDEEVSDDAKTFIRNLKRDGILRYRDDDTDAEDPRSRYRGRRR